ncbi:kinase-like domain-containing protein [Pisolithus tinctorius]|nr:kinase-like domain-containing protein [Pisolithus tinctorius]
MELQQFLRQLAEGASKYDLSLDGRIERDPMVCLRAGNALVYRGKLRPEGRIVAIKAALDGPQVDESVIKRILGEACAWSKLKHPNILGLLGITVDFDLAVSIVTNWVERGNANHYVQERDNDPRPLVKDIALGLRYLHSRPGGPIVHGSLRGENVLITDDGRAVLTDFGLSFLYNSAFAMTTSPLAGGTLRWMAPELVSVMPAEDPQPTVEGDIWALGMTALELFTRKLPYHNLTNIGAIQSRILSGPPERPSDKDTLARMTDKWWALCSRCLRMNPALRIGAEDAVKEIRELPPRNDIVIVVMGPRRSGISNFINKLANCEEGREADKLIPRMHGIRELTLDLPCGRRYVLVDTPGFDDTSWRTQYILRELANWLHDKYFEDVKITGVIYTHRVTDDHISRTVRENLDQFRRLCGDKAAQHVQLVTTWWDEQEDKEATPNWVPQLGDCLPIAANVHHERFRFFNTQGSALDIVNRLVGEDAVLTEEKLVEAERHLHDTNVARPPYSRFSWLWQQIKEFLKTLRSSLGDALTWLVPGSLKRVQGH